MVHDWCAVIKPASDDAQLKPVDLEIERQAGTMRNVVGGI
jgi:hypothetical protein